MVSFDDIRELLAFKTEAPAVVSLYVDLREDRGHVAQARSMIQESLAKDPLLAPLREECEAIGSFVAGFDPRSWRGLAVFSARRGEFWRAIPLPESPGQLLRAAPEPSLARLHGILDQYQRFGVALVSPERARLLEIHLGEIQEHPFEAGGEASLAEPRRIADPLHRHLQRVADALLSLTRRRGLNRVILGAPPELQPLLLHHLHTHIQDNLIVDSQMDPGMSPPEVLKRVETGERESRKVRESVLVYRLLDAVKSDSLGVVGMAPTLQALHRGQVRLLLVRDGLAKMGRLCPHCGALGLSGRKCVYCWLDTEPIVNLVGELLDRAWQQGCEVVRLLHEARLDTHGGIGAELSFKAPAEAPAAAADGSARPVALSTAPPSTQG